MGAEPGLPAAGSVLLVLSPLVALIGWARWRVGAHTVAQAIVATVLAVVITVARVDCDGSGSLTWWEVRAWLCTRPSSARR